MGSLILFDLECILNRKYMNNKTYWSFKEEFEKDNIHNHLLSDECNLDFKLENLTYINLKILENLSKIRNLLESNKLIK